jgi:hypothetical protein
MHTFEIVTTHGRDLGTMRFARPDWPSESVFYRCGAGPDLRVVDHRPGDGPPVLVVEELPAPRARA